MKWAPDYVKQLPDNAFAYIASDGSRHLPFKSSEGRVSLPHVREALCELDDVPGMSAADKAAAKDKLQGSLKASDADDECMSFVSPIEATDGDKLPTRMMLLRAGTFHTSKYGEVPLKASDLEQMASNFQDGIGMAGSGETGIPVDFSHKSGDKAAAWIKGMEVQNGKELWATDIEWSRAGREAIIGKEFKMLSSDFYPASFGQWVDAESGVRAKNVIVGAALTNRPMFSGNQPVIASETVDEAGNRQTIKYVIASEKEQSMNIDALRVKAADEVSGPEQRFLQENYAELSADERTKFSLVEPVQAADDKNKDGKPVEASSVKGDEGVVSVQASDIKAMSDRIGSLEASEKAARKTQIEADVDKAIGRGAIKADQKDKWVSLIEADEGNSDLLAGLADNPLLAKEQLGSGDADETSNQAARDQLMAHATTIVKESDGKTDIKAAYAMAKEQHPELVAAATEEGKARFTASADQFAAAGVNQG